jgi:integrase/recombinase XerD
MLRLYRRHSKRCRFYTGNTNGNRNQNNCRCAIWVDGRLQGERVNKGLHTRNWTRANEIARDWEIAQTVKDEKLAATSVREACDTFLADAEARHLSSASIKKYRVLLINRRQPADREKFSPSLSEFCAESGVQFTNQIKLVNLTEFRSQWKDGALSSAKKLERLRAFGRFLVDRGWWLDNMALKLRRPTVNDPPTMPYTLQEITALLAACDRFTDWHGKPGQENAHRLRAFLLFLRYSALRVTDAASCAVDRLTGNRLFLYTQKTGVPVHIPLPPFVVAALDACPRKSERYWFWTGEGSKQTLAGNWRRAFRRLCEIAGVKGGHPHRFRDTLAVELLLEGVPMERVQALLGHSSLKVTEKHYAPWVHSRQAQLEADLARVWGKDPIVQASIDLATRDGQKPAIM